MKRGCQVFAVTAIAVATSAVQGAGAQEFPPATDRDYAIDLYSGNAIGSNEIVSMGGAAVAVARGSAGMTINPAAAGVRSQTSTDKWDWDAHVDWLGAVSGNDFDNNGIADDTVTNVAPQVTLGVVGNYRQWALGLTGSFIQFENEAPSGRTLRNDGVTIQLHVARSFWDEQLVVGGGFKSAQFALSANDDSETDVDLFLLQTTSIEGGVVWAPHDRNLRVGGAISLPATGDKVAIEECDPLSCEGLILPNRFEVPWSATVGVGLRRAATRWNRKVKARFVDERQLIVALDVRLTGSVPDGHGIGQFSQGRLQPSGDRIAISVRGGAEYTWVPGRFRVRGGSYWEPSRFRDTGGDAVSGRAHLTLGADLRVWQFRVFSRDYRVRLSFTFDGASKYINSGLSIGFWH